MEEGVLGVLGQTALCSAASVVQAVGRTAKKAEGPHKQPVTVAAGLPQSSSSLNEPFSWTEEDRVEVLTGEGEVGVLQLHPLKLSRQVDLQVDQRRRRHHRPITDQHRPAQTSTDHHRPAEMMSSQTSRELLRGHGDRSLIRSRLRY